MSVGHGADRVEVDVELLVEDGGLPRAVQLNPPVLKVIGSQPVVFAFESLKMFQLPSGPGPDAGHTNQLSLPSCNRSPLSAIEKVVVPVMP
jgi:hypothetical protein